MPSLSIISFRNLAAAKDAPPAPVRKEKPSQRSPEASITLAAADGKTAGTRYYLLHGVRGIRGEAQDGFPHIVNVAIPAYKRAERLCQDENLAGIYTLLSLIASVEDTSLYKRGGVEGAALARAAAAELIKKEELPTLSDVYRLDEEFIRRNLSPGGSADLLALCYFFLSTENFD